KPDRRNALLRRVDHSRNGGGIEYFARDHQARMERGLSLALQRGEPMTPGRYRQINQLFSDAREQAREDRDAFLKEACGGDHVLLHEVERMLAAYEQASSFLNAPAWEKQ